VTPLDIRTESLEGVAVISVCGEIDIASLPRLSACLDRLTTPFLVLDLTGLRFCDSSGLGLIVRSWKVLKARSGALALAAPQRQVTRLLHTTGLDTRISVHPTVPEAVRNLAALLIAAG
jgi:anti-sigma B factor antagonist